MEQRASAPTAVAVGNHDEAQQLEEGGDQSRHIGHRGGAEDFADGGRFIGLDQTEG